MNQITNFFPQELVHATGWTLLHSLWQGAFVALLLGLLLLLLHRQSARLRYAVAGGAMLAQLLLAIATFSNYYNQAPEATLSAKASAPYITAPVAEVYIAPAQSSFWEAPFEVAQVYFEQHMPLLVTLWLLGMLVMAIRFIGGVAYTQRLRHYRTTPLGANWQQQLSAISEAMGVKQAVRLVESALVQVPIAIGFTKPVILLPVGAVTGLTQAQVEAVLAHELAHILRRDYLINLLQSVVDMLFFYHPVVWWMSGIVRAERENCCDDIAVAVCGDTLTYARALAEIEAMRLPAAPAIALAFSGKRGSLMSRIKRLVGQQSLKPTFTEGFAAALVLVTGLLVLSFGAMASLKPQADSDTTLAEKVVAFKDVTENDAAEDADEAAGAYAYTVQDSDGKNRDIVIIKNKRGKVKELYVDGKRIPKKDMDDYAALIEQRLQATARAPRANRQEVKQQIQQEREAVAEARHEQDQNWSFDFNFPDSFNFSFADSFHFDYTYGDSLVPPPPMPPVPPLPAPPAPPAPAIVPPVPPVPPVAPFESDKKAQQKFKKEQKRYDKEMKEFEQEMQRYEKEMKEYKQEIEKFMEEHHKGMTMHAATQQEMARVQAQHSKEMARQHQAMAREQQAQMQRLKDELVKDGIIKKGDDTLNIQLNNGSLYINGKKQPQELYEKYKKLMNIEVKDESNFNFQYKSN
jgi:beta-lactamase regulating signal transducer with metallopeptidase domain